MNKIIEDSSENFWKKVGGVDMFAGEVPMSENERFSERLVTLSEQQELDHVIEVIDKTHDVNILYAASNNDEQWTKVVLFTLPADNEMYVFELETSQYGIVDKINLIFFSSMEYMYSSLLQELQNIKKLDCKIEEIVSVPKLNYLFLS